MRFDLKFLDSFLIVLWSIIIVTLSIASLYTINPGLFKPFKNVVTTEGSAMVFFFVFFCATAWRLTEWQQRMFLPIALPCFIGAWIFTVAVTQNANQAGIVTATALVADMLILGVLGSLNLKDYVIARIGLKKPGIRKPKKVQ